MARVIKEAISGLTPEEATRVLWEREPILQYIGYRLVKLEPGYAEAQLEHRALRMGGILHGGAIVTALDQTMMLAVLTVNDGYDQATVELKVNFLEPGRAGPYTVAGRVVRRGRTLAVAEGEMREGDRVLAKALGTWYLIQGPTSFKYGDMR